ncbi:TolC family protein [bacterium]|nr:TolC family protein [bacterium]
MKNLRALFAILIVLAVSAFTAYAQEEPLTNEPASGAKIPVLFTLDDLMDYSLRHSPTLARLDIESTRAGLSRDLELFFTDPNLSFSARAYHSESAGSTSSVTQSGVSKTEGMSFDLSFTKPMITGDSLRLSHSLYTTDVNITGAEIPTTWGQSLSASYTWQVMKDRGEDVTLLSYYMQVNAFDLKQAEIEHSVRSLFGSVAASYYTVAYLKESARVEEETLEYYKKLLDRNVERHKVGLALKSDVLQAENAVLSQEAGLVSTKARLEDAMDALKELIGYREGAPIEVAPLDIDGFEPTTLHEEDLWNRVLATDFTLKQLDSTAINYNLSEAYYKNQLKPDIDLTASLSTQGEDDNFGGAFGEITNAQNYSLTLNYNLPWGKREIKNRIEQNELMKNELAEQRLQVLDSLRTSYESLRREIATTIKTLELARSNVAVASENADIMRERQRVGLATTLDVLDGERNLLSAKLSYLSAVADHKRAEYDLMVLAGLIQWK